MWQAILGVLSWLLKHWKVLFRIGITLFGTYLAALASYKGLQLLGTWLFGHTADLFSYFTTSINDVRSAIQNLEVEYADSFVILLVRATALDEFASLAVGWAEMLIAVAGWVLLGILLAFVGYLIRLVWIKFQKTAVDYVSQGSGGLGS